MGHGEKSGKETISKEYTILDSDASHPVIQKIVAAHDLSELFHKEHGKVVHKPFHRAHRFTGHSIHEILEKLFLNSDLICLTLEKEGYEGFNAECHVSKFKTQDEKQFFKTATKGLLLELLLCLY